MCACELARAIRRQVLGHLPGRVQLDLVERRQLADHLGERRREPLDLRLAHARQHRPQRRDVRGVRRDVAAAGGLAQPLAVQRLLVAHVEDERHAHELDAALEALEVRDLAERGEVDVVAAADEHEIEEQGRARHRQRGALDGREQILVVLERALEQIVELDHAAVRADDLAAVLVQRHRLQRRRQRRERAIRGDLALGRVDRQLRLDGDPALAIAMRDLEALDADVAQHLDVVALVAREQRVVDRAVARRQRAVRAGSRRRSQPACRVASSLSSSCLALVERDQQQRMIAELVAEARVDRVVGQVRERVGRLDRRDAPPPKPMPPRVLFCAGKIHEKR